MGKFVRRAVSYRVAAVTPPDDDPPPFTPATGVSLLDGLPRTNGKGSEERNGADHTRANHGAVRPNRRGSVGGRSGTPKWRGMAALS
jgi:hypothetical protein